jgi:hypothetical protein
LKRNNTYLHLVAKLAIIVFFNCMTASNTHGFIKRRDKYERAENY